MSAAVIPNQRKERVGSIQSAQSLNLFSPGAAASLPRDDEVTMHMYPRGEERADEIIIMPSVGSASVTETKITTSTKSARRSETPSAKAPGNFVLNSAKGKFILNGDLDSSHRTSKTTESTVSSLERAKPSEVERNSTIERKIVTTSTSKVSESTSSDNKELIKKAALEGSKMDSTSVSSSRSGTTERKIVKRSGSNAKVKKAGSFQLNAGTAPVTLPTESSKIMKDDSFKSNLEATLERKSKGGVTASHKMSSSTGNMHTEPNVSLPNGDINSTNISVSRSGRVERSTEQSDGNDSITHHKRITSGGEASDFGNLNSFLQKHQEKLNSNSGHKVSRASHDSSIIANGEDTGSTNLTNTQHNSYSYSSRSTNISPSTTKDATKESRIETRDPKSKGRNSQVGSFTFVSYEDGKSLSSASVKSGTSSSSQSKQIDVELGQAKRTSSEIGEYTTEKGKQSESVINNSTNVNARARSSYTLDDSAGRSSEQTVHTGTRGDVVETISTQPADYIASSIERKFQKAKQEASRDSNVSEWSYRSENGQVSRPNSLAVNSQKLKSDIGQQLVGTLPTNREITTNGEDTATIFSAGRISERKYQFEHQEFNRPTSPAAAEAQGTIRSGLVNKIAVELKDKPLTGRSLDSSTLERSKTPVNSSNGDTLPRKQPKFLVEGIDIPATSTSPEQHQDTETGTLRSQVSLGSLESGQSTLKKAEKEGFTYLKNKELTSKVLKKAEDVTAKKPHEVVETRTLEQQLRAKSPVESEPLVEARSHLHHVDRKRPSADLSADKSAQSPIQVNLKKTLLGEIRRTVNEKEATSVSVGKAAGGSQSEPSTIVITKTTKSHSDGSHLSKTDIPVRVERNSSKKENKVIERNITTISAADIEKGKATIYVNEVNNNRTDKTNNNLIDGSKVLPDSAYESNPTSPAFNFHDFDVKTTSYVTPKATDMVVQQSTIQTATMQPQAPQGSYKAEKMMKSSYSTKVSGQPEKKMESETKESYEWHSNAKGQVTEIASSSKTEPASVTYSIPHKSSSKAIHTSNAKESTRDSLRNDRPAPAVAPMQTVEVDIENRHSNAHHEVTAPTVKHVQSMFETQNLTSGYGANQEIVNGPVATSSMYRSDARKTPDADLNFQKVPTIRSAYERKAFDGSYDQPARPTEPVGTFQNLQSLKTNYEYRSTGNDMPSTSSQRIMKIDEVPGGVAPVVNGQAVHMSRFEQRQTQQSQIVTSSTTTNQQNVGTGQHFRKEERPKKRRRKHVTNVNLEGEHSEGGYASSSDAGSMHIIRTTPSPHPTGRVVSPNVAGQTLISPNYVNTHTGRSNRSQQSAMSTSYVTDGSTSTEKILTPHLREATEENGQYHIKLDINSKLQQAMKNSMMQQSESMTREEMMRNEQYASQTYSSNAYGGAGYGTAGQAIEGSTLNSRQVNGYDTSTSAFQSYGSRGPTPTHLLNGGKTDFIMGVNQTISLDVPGRGRSPAPRNDDTLAVKSLTRTDRVSNDQMNVVRGSILIKNAIDTTGAPKVVDVVEDTYSEENFNIEDNANLFHGKYYQSRENPMYSSDQDLTNPALYQDEVDNRRVVRRERVRSLRDVPKEEVIDYNSNIKYRKVPVRHDTSSSWTYHQERQPYESDSLESVEFEQQQKNEDEDEMFEEWSETKKHTYYKELPNERTERRTRRTSTEYELAKLLRDAPPDSVKQTINVEREEEEIVGPLPLSHADGSSSVSEGMLNFDAISEKVNMGIQDGTAQLAVKVRCERVVPVYGQEEVYKKSSVIVTRLIEIDMEATEERMRLYQNIMRGGVRRGMIEDGSRSYGSSGTRQLSTKDTFKLYKTFMGLAEEHEGMQREQMHIEKKVEDNAPQPDFDMDAEVHRISSRNIKSPESDTVSYMSAASEHADILY